MLNIFWEKVQKALSFLLGAVLASFVVVSYSTMALTLPAEAMEDGAARILYERISNPRLKPVFKEGASFRDWDNRFFVPMQTNHCFTLKRWLTEFECTDQIGRFLRIFADAQFSHEILLLEIGSVQPLGD